MTQLALSICFKGLGELYNITKTIYKARKSFCSLNVGTSSAARKVDIKITNFLL